MERPLPGEAPDWPFALHQSFGMVGLGVLAPFWLWTLVRHRAETPLARLVPGFRRRGAPRVVADVVRVVRALAALRAPPLPLDALAGAVHGLGLLVASFLAISGAAWFFSPRRNALRTGGARRCMRRRGQSDVGLSGRPCARRRSSTACWATTCFPVCSGSKRRPARRTAPAE